MQDRGLGELAVEQSELDGRSVRKSIFALGATAPPQAGGETGKRPRDIPLTDHDLIAACLAIISKKVTKPKISRKLF